MGKIRKTYDVKFKKKAVDLYLKEGMGYETVAKELGIHHSMVQRWVKHYEQEGMKGLEEKRGKAQGPGMPAWKTSSAISRQSALICTLSARPKR
jgi:transposase